jgi:hypothetical protein
MVGIGRESHRNLFFAGEITGKISYLSPPSLNKETKINSLKACQGNVQVEASISD